MSIINMYVNNQYNMYVNNQRNVCVNNEQKTVCRSSFLKQFQFSGGPIHYWHTYVYFNNEYNMYVNNE